MPGDAKMLLAKPNTLLGDLDAALSQTLREVQSPGDCCKLCGERHGEHARKCAMRPLIDWRQKWGNGG